MSSTSDWGPNHCTMSVPRPACNLCKSHMTPCLQRSLLRRSSPLLLQSIKAPTLRRVAPIPTRTVSSMAPKPKNEIKNKWVAVVGASRGIGLEFARQFLEKGNMVIAGVRDIYAPGLLELQKMHPDNLYVSAIDVENQRSIITWSRQLLQRTNHIDLLINSAGVATWDGLEDVTEREMMDIFRCNTVGPLLVTKYVLFTGNVLKSGSQICNITSKMGSCADNTSGGAYAYRASKAALNIVTESLAIDLKERGIAACLLHPGWVRTDMTRGAGAIDAKTSVGGMISVLEAHSPQDITGKWYDYKGVEIPW